ncbi:MAG TPA: T9SS type A sorting domain-containing protein [Hymenobacter sp.]|jgi:photosystem II stability/assembly factor-like uncharacterized protein|uniref:T9SS type A sorting domain-containing protein n=1 Tax=Hymenobacter sp. TaxID=1898978 RepID=UPI002ED8BA3B
MKKMLLFLGLLGFSSAAYAQGPWVEVNTTNPAAFPPGYSISDVNAVNANLVWAVASEDSPQGVPNRFLVTNNATGTEFDFGAVVGAVVSGFQTANIAGINALTALAATHGDNMTGGGEILRTTNGGQSWVKVSTASQFVANQGGFCNFVHMFDANEGVSVGDPTNGYFEILRTTDGGVTWTRIPSANIPAPFTGEAALVGSYFVRGNTMWFGGASTAAVQERVFKSVDRGVTWTVSTPTPLTENLTHIAFKDDLNGIAYNTKATGTVRTAANYIRTTDGGATWATFTPVNTTNGSFFLNDIDAVNGVYYSAGPRFPQGATQVAEDFGSSFSTDGVNWTNMTISSGRRAGYFFSIDLIPGATAGTTVGYGGLLTDGNGAGGVFKFSRTPTATRNAELQRELSVYPNPSATGLFKVEFGGGLKAGAQLSVVDVLGRRVQAQTLTATTIGAKSINLDLSNEKVGVYTLQIRTDAGIATQKIVVE